MRIVPLHAACAATLVAMAIAACTPATQATAPVYVTTVGTRGTSNPTVATPSAAPKAPTTANEVLAQGRAPFEACYALARRTNPNLGHTNVSITFTRNDEGKLISVELVYRNRMDDAAKDCMRNAAEALQFPPSIHGTQVGIIEFAPPS